ncbi:ABC transporter permease [Marinicrinis lubricantis]|uniref:ABC transporter permease n=1 Tax=Marinicrinis lubricantis TaxID=2086470 RepID=A0ABW1INX2_9BACL
MRSMIKHWLHIYGYAAAFAALIVALWEACVRLDFVPSFIIPAPSQIAVAIWIDRHPLFAVHLPVTLGEVLLGLGLSVGGGVLLAILMHLYRPVERMLYPLVIVSQTIPIIAISPVFILWFGYTVWSKVAVTILIAFFPVVVNTYDGLRQGDKEYGELLRTMGASRLQLLTKVQIPMALPSFFSGLKLAVVFSVIGATIGEWLGASAGLGYFSRRMSSSLRADELFAAVVLLSLLGMLLFGWVSLLERRMLRRTNIQRRGRSK